MQGTILDIKRFAVHDGPGIRTTVFLKGCPLRCLWCHNPESWMPDPEVVTKKVMLDSKEFVEKETIGRLMTVGEVMAEVEKERLVMEESGGGITISGGEPLMQPRFLVQLLQESVTLGFHTAVDTSGYGLLSDLQEIVPLTGLFLYDLKCMNETDHERHTGVPNSLILNNFRWLIRQGKPVRVRIPVVGGYTGTRDNLSAILGFLLPFAGKIEQIDLLPYHRIGMHKYDKLGIPCKMPGEKGKLPENELFEWKEKLETKGFRVKIGG